MNIEFVFLLIYIQKYIIRISIERERNVNCTFTIVGCRTSGSPKILKSSLFIMDSGEIIVGPIADSGITRNAFL